MARLPTVSVWMGGPSRERDISLISGKTVAEGLQKGGFSVQRVEIGEDLRFAVDDSEPRKLNDCLRALTSGIDVVFPALHGPYGEDGKVQGLLETLGLPYVGSGVATSAIAMNKILTRRIAAAEGLLVAHAVDTYSPKSEADWSSLLGEINRLSFPVYVKPNELGSSVGISRVASESGIRDALEEAFLVCDQLLVEEEVQGREFSVPILDRPDGDARALPVIEIIPHARDFFDYHAKYTEGATDEVCPADVDREVGQRLSEYAMTIHRALGCRSLSRSDFLVSNDGDVVFLEINTIPGLTPMSLFPKGARADGMTYEELVRDLVLGVAREA